jgi:hypothetical protein
MIIGRNKTQFKLGPAITSSAYHNYSERPVILGLNKSYLRINPMPRRFYNRNLTKDNSTNEFNSDQTQLKYEELRYFGSFKDIMRLLGRFSK